MRYLILLFVLVGGCVSDPVPSRVGVATRPASLPATFPATLPVTVTVPGPASAPTPPVEYVLVSDRTLVVLVVTGIVVTLVARLGCRRR